MMAFSPRIYSTLKFTHVIEYDRRPHNDTHKQNDMNKRWQTTRELQRTTFFSQPLSRLGCLIHRLLLGHELGLPSCRGYGVVDKKINATYGRCAELTYIFRKPRNIGLHFYWHGLPIIASCICYKCLLLRNTSSKWKHFRVFFIINTLKWIRNWK
jgi:hypothetical protein